MPPPSEAFVRDYDRLRWEAASFPLEAWALVELSGEDRLDWLQGQATNDVRRLTSGGALSFCLCEPTGHLLAPVDAWALDDRILMTVPRECVEAVLARVERMTIMEDVAARQLPEMRGVSIQGPQATERLATLLSLPNLDAAATSALTFRSDRSGSGGWDVWLFPNAEGLEAEIQRAVAPADPLAVEAARIEAGLPRWGVDLGPRTLPAEMGPEFEAQHVSYQKGCYTGQEVLMRMHSRGHTNKTWVGLVSASPLEVGAPVLFEGVAVGKVASAAPSPRFGGVAAATLRNEATERNEATGEGARVQVGEAEAQVRPMPILRPL